MNNRQNILVTGANGQLGKEFGSIIEQYPNYNFILVSKEQLPVNDRMAVADFLSANNIAYCINCAAYTAVDKAETEKDIAFDINGYAVGALAAICKKRETRLFHFSTDYVFNGKSAVPYKENDSTEPVNTYGASKLLGEQEAQKNNPDVIIIRTSWVYSSFGKNFLKTMLRLMHEKESISVVNDQLGCPTYANDLAKAVMEIICHYENPLPGIYNYCNQGIINWYEFALAIKEISGSACKVNPISTLQYPTPAKRPHYSVLDTEKISTTFNIEIPSWKHSLETCISKMNL